MIDTIKELLARRALSPFRVNLSSEDSYEVRHPEGGLHVGLPGGKSNGDGELPDRAIFCSALHLAGVEQLVNK
jgi:hypothetical protein